MSEESETFITRLAKGGLSSRGYRSLRITVPKKIVHIIGLKHGDYVRVTIKKIELKEAEE